VQDLQQFRKELERASILIAPDDTLPDVGSVYAADPFGNRIEFIQDGDGFAQRSPYF
jgi:hypothetical protein